MIQFAANMDSIGVIALLLAIPLSVAANLLTPIVRNWWALSSMKRLENRIKKLENHLTKIESREFSKEVYIAFGYIFLSITFISFSLLVETMGKIQQDMAKALNLFSYILFASACFVAATGGRRFTTENSGRQKKYIEKTLITLKQKREKKSLAAKN